MFVRSAVPDLITTQGTNISDAINTCIENFPKNDEAQKVIVLLSDGEDHDELAEDLAAKAKQNNISIFTVGTGTEQGGLIPMTITKIINNCFMLRPFLISNFLYELGFEAHGTDAGDFTIYIMIPGDKADVFDLGSHLHDQR